MKKGVICLVIMYTPGVMVIKMSKMAQFLYFLLTPAKKISLSLDKTFMFIWKISLRSFRKCYGLLDSELPLARYQPLKIQSFFANSAVFLYFYPRYLTNSNSETY